jgi:hypothetical protein
MMNTTQTASPFDAMQDNPEWGGYGYLGERNNFLDTDDEDCLEWMGHEERAEVVAEVDALILGYRNWTPAQLFEWANSKTGRHFADTVFDEPVAVRANFERACDWRLL